jgi:hypothetical protein
MLSGQLRRLLRFHFWHILILFLMSFSSVCCLLKFILDLAGVEASNFLLLFTAFRRVRMLSLPNLLETPRLQDLCESAAIWQFLIVSG